MRPFFIRNVPVDVAVRIQEAARLRTIAFLVDEAIRLSEDSPVLAARLLDVLATITACLSIIPPNDDDAI